MARLPRLSKRQAAMLRAYLRELRCVDEYIKQVHGILRRSTLTLTLTLTLALTLALALTLTLTLTPGARHPAARGAAA